MEKLLMKGNEAIGEAALKVGCRFFFGYPITPQNELPAYMARRMPEVGGTYLQAESELAAINMVYGAAGTGARVMTSSSSPGISLKQEGISYLAGAELPCVIVNIVRCGPGLGGILASQGDYFQATRGGGHGDYRLIVLAPASVQEMAELTALAFELSDKYRNPAMVLADAILGQMMEPVRLGDLKAKEPSKPWATTGAQGRTPNIINSLEIVPELLETHNRKLQDKYAWTERTEIRWEGYRLEGAKIIVAAYGVTARIVRSAVAQAREEGIPVGLFRPITLYPFPTGQLSALTREAARCLVVEMSAGQMVDDVRLAVEGRCPVEFYGRMGGMVPTPREILGVIRQMAVSLQGGTSA
ncbi:MAG: 3-methyl-2-oxobutanoate dehydrogenase subunit VorB [Limnochordia bacterium]